jgi:predicted dehydrogenase
VNGELRWGVLSTADIGRGKVVPAFQKARRTRVVAVASRDAARAADFGAQLGISKSYDSYEALLADPDVDAVYIPLPNHMHLEWTLAAARAGKHVLCEKPLALTSADAERMVASCESAGVRLMEAFMYRLHPSWVAVREMVAAGRIGQLRAVQSWFSFYNDDPANIRNIREMGGGALYDIGCYCINLSRILFGEEPSRVRGAIVRDAQTGVDVLTSGILEFGDGIASFTCSTRTETDQRVHIYGTQGRISIGIPFNIPPDRPTEVFVTVGAGAPGSPHTDRLLIETADPYTLEAETFAAMVLDGVEPPFPARDAVANLVVMERIVADAEGAG